MPYLLHRHTTYVYKRQTTDSHAPVMQSIVMQSMIMNKVEKRVVVSSITP